MKTATVLLSAAMLCAGHATAQTLVFGFRGNGDVISIDVSTGRGSLVARSGIECDAATALNFSNSRAGQFHRLVFGGGTGATADQLSVLDGWSVAPQAAIPTSGRPAGYGIQGLAYTYSSIPNYFALLASNDPTAPELLASIDAGNYSVIGPVSRSDLWSIARSPASGLYYTLAASGDGALFQIDTATGALTAVGTGGGFGNARSLVFLPDGRLLACGDNLYSVNLTTGVPTLIGPTGFTDIRGLAEIDGCYADCDVGPPPQLNVNDFICFQARFASGSPYANCDLSTTPPVLNINDFICFQQRFAAGCP